ncbi:MAG: hypothetical protein A3F13_05940 [Gammaproteobacteria bacterium RIFCSPHIGHO2_12_FULL_40_19]|nr:MAG: hypothetical protein A3F13_05940 [Gammaproteobacteria bacterium RIFCSPHIGHO2_12_FULL_40_19]
MRNWTALESDITALQSTPCLWPDSLSSDLQRIFLSHNRYVLERLIMFVRLPIAIDEKEMRIRQFIAMRWRVIANSSIDYTLNPDFPANQACLKMAVFIAKREESVCQIVMPSISHVLGTGFSADDVKSASEDIDGKFIPQNFLICLNNKALISIVDLYESARANTNHLFRNPEAVDTAFHFTPEDLERLRLISGEVSKAYFDSLNRIHQARHNQRPSVGFALKTLQQALSKSSKVELGADEIANIAEYRLPIFQFYQLWIVLPADIKATIKDYKANGATSSLESYLLFLFVCIKEFCPEIEVIEAEVQRVCAEAIFPCTHQIGLQLDSLINHHPNLFDMPLSDRQPRDATTLPDAETLALFPEQLRRAISERLPLLGWDDQRCMHSLSCFEMLTQYCLEPRMLEKDFLALNNAIKTIEDLTYALTVLPVSQWEFFIKGLRPEFIEQVFHSRHASLYFTRLMTHLPSENWLLFFNAFHAADLSQYMDSAILATLLNALPESQSSILINAMQKILGIVFQDGVDIVYLFVSTAIDNWEKTYDLFAHQIESILKNPKELMCVINMIHQSEWPLFINLFKKNISEHLKHSHFLEITLMDLRPDARMPFLRLLAPSFDQISLTFMSFVRILQMFRSISFAEIFSLFGASRIAELINKDTDFAALLNNFSEVDRIIFVGQLPLGSLNIKMGASELCYLLKRFPECESGFLRLFKKQLPQILSSFLASFSLFDNFEREIPSEFVSTFKFLSVRALPLLLSSRTIAEFCASFFMHRFFMFRSLPDPVWAVYHSFKKVERALMAGELTSMEGVTQKIALLNDFMRETMSGEAQPSLFNEELLQCFGKDFFSQLDKYLTRFSALTPVDALAAQLDIVLGLVKK